MKMDQYEAANCSDTIKDFGGLVFKGVEPLVGDNETAVKIAISTIEGTLTDIANGNGRFEGLSAGELVQSKNRAIDDAVSQLSDLIGCSARLAVCMAIVAIGVNNEKGLHAIAA